MNDIELELAIKIEKSLTGLGDLKNDLSNIQEVTKKVTTDMQQQFKKVSPELNNLLKAIKPVAGSVEDLALKLDMLKESASKVKIGSEEFNKLKKEIKDTQQELNIATGKWDEFGNRVRHGAAETFHTMTEVAAGIAGVFNLSALAGFGDKVGEESALAEKALRGLVIIESLRAVGLGVLKAKELALEIVETARNKAQVISAALARAQAVATGVLTGEITLATIATTAFNAAIKALTGPIGIFLGLLGATLLAIELFTDNTEEETDALIENSKAVTANAKARGELLGKILDLRTQVEEQKAVLNGALSEEQKILERANAEKKRLQEKFDEENRINLLEGSTEILEIRKKLLDGTKAGEEKFNQAASAQNIKFFTDAKLRETAYLLEREKINLKAREEINNIAKRKDKEREQDADKAARRLLQLQKDLAEALRELEARSNKATAENLGSQERIKFEADLALKELEAFKAQVIEKGKLTDKNFKLSAEQEKQFSLIKLGIQQQFFKDSTALFIDSEAARLTLLTDSLDKELAIFENGFISTSKKLRDAGASEDEIELERRRKRREIIVQFNTDQLKDTEQVLLNEQDARERGAENEIAFTRALEEMKLQIRIEFAKKQLAVLLVDPEKNKVDISALRKAIREAQTQLNDLQNSAPEFSLAALLGIKNKDGSGLSAEQEKEFNDTANGLVDSMQRIAEAGYRIRKEQVDREKALNDELLRDLNDKVNEEERMLDRELEARNKGYANDVENVKKSLASAKAERQKALEDKKRIQAEERKLARQQAAIEAIQQVAALLSAGAKLFSKEVSRGGAVGVVTALGAIAAMIAGFLELKANVQKAEVFEEGGWVKGKRHSEGGVHVEAEEGEFYMKRKQAQRHPRILEAINDDNMKGVPLIDLQNLLAGTGVTVVKEEVTGVSNRGTEVRISEGRPAPTASPRRELQEIRDDVKSIREQMRNREQVTDDGKTKTIKKGNHITIIRKNG